MLRRIVVCIPLGLALVCAEAVGPTSPATPAPMAPSSAGADEAPPKPATQHGRGGAVSSVDPYATAIGIQVLADGGNAVDAAVATAAALGVTEPYSAGVGGGGYFVYYDAATGKVRTLDGRETAPASMPDDAFIDPKTGEPYPFTPDLVTSGVSVGVPGTPKTWTTALRKWGTRSLAATLRPAAQLARTGFEVDRTFRKQTKDNRERFKQFWSTKALFLKGGKLPRVGSTLTNPQLARTYTQFGRQGASYFYRGQLPADIVRAVRKPPTVKKPSLPIPKGFLTRQDLRRYDVLAKAPTHVDYRGVDVYGMAGSSSGGTAVGEALNIIEASADKITSSADLLHYYLEASALAFADRAAYVGDDEFVDVPRAKLLSQQYADERACLIDPAKALTKPVAAGDVATADGACGAPAARGEVADDTENESTTHLTVADKWGNVVAYTLTIEQTGGSGIVVPGRGFLLNNELTDFSTVYEAGDPNRIEGGKRPRSSMSPTIVLEKGKPVLALGSPGGSTIITTVLQVLASRLQFAGFAEAIAAPRASQRNTATVTAEQRFIDDYGAALEALGHEFVPAGDGLTSDPFIGAVAAVELGPGRRMSAGAEPTRRGGGAARVVHPVR